jgi:hypothetical protein
MHGHMKVRKFSYSFSLIMYKILLISQTSCAKLRRQKSTSPSVIQRLGYAVAVRAQVVSFEVAEYRAVIMTEISFFLLQSVAIMGCQRGFITGA